MNKEILTRPFPPELVRQRQGQGGKMLSYVPTFAVVERLNQAFDGAWSFEVVKHELVGDDLLVLGRLVAGSITKEAFGGATVTRNSGGFVVELGDTAKAAASDALKKAASLLGVGLELHRGGAPVQANGSPGRASPAPVGTPSVGDRLTARQLTAIHAAARRRGIAPVDLAAMLVEITGKSELQQLTRREASAVIDELTGTNGAAA